MFGRIKSILTGGKGSQDEDSYVSGIKKGANTIFGLLKEHVANTIVDLKLMREKSKNLLQTNVALGLKHLNNDKLSDAIFRFRVVALFWPSHVKTYYYLAHCYVLKKDYRRADMVIKRLLSMDPSYESKVSNMVNKINNDKSEEV